MSAGRPAYSELFEMRVQPPTRSTAYLLLLLGSRDAKDYTFRQWSCIEFVVVNLFPLPQTYAGKPGLGHPVALGL